MIDHIFLRFNSCGLFDIISEWKNKNTPTTPVPLPQKIATFLLRFHLWCMFSKISFLMKSPLDNKITFRTYMWGNCVSI